MSEYQRGPDLRAQADALKAVVDCADLAERLDLKKGPGGNYHSPHHPDKNPSLSVFAEGRAFKDFSDANNPKAGGDCIALYQYVTGVEFGEALKALREMYGLPEPERPREPKRRGRPPLAEMIAEQSRNQAKKAVEWLEEARGIPQAVSRAAVKSGALGWNGWTSSEIAAGEPMHGGPAAAFVVRSLNPGRVVAVDLRFEDPALNGGLKTKTLGEKEGTPWVADLRQLQKARLVYVVESPINALSVAACGMRNTAAVAVRGTNVGAIDWSFLRGKTVRVAMDYDQPDQHGRCAGQEAGWTLLERLTALNIPARLVDQQAWPDAGLNDVNDVLQAEGAEALDRRLKQLDQWAIAGMPGTGDYPMRRRVWLPGHDWRKYLNYRVEDDFTRLATTRKDPETGGVTTDYEDVAGFRVAAITRVSVAGATSVMSGDRDTAPRLMFAATVQTPRAGDQLMRRTMEDEDLHNLDRWRKFGPIFAPARFARLLSMLERTAHIGEHQAVNFVGLAWRNGELAVNEGADCYFPDPRKQCPYHELSFPRGSIDDGRRVMAAWGETFRANAARMLLVWGLGGHLKVLLGFWPHMMVQADKGAGKSTLAKRLERTIGMTVFGGQSLQTEFRLLTSVSHTCHPVGWEELSARKQQVIDSAVSMLQESYQFTITRRNNDMTEYLQSAPVLLVGEDVPVRSLIQKMVRTDLNNRKGQELDEELPPFPVYEWLQWLSGQEKKAVRDLYARQQERMLSLSRATGDDAGASRIVNNYAAVATAWLLLCEFLGTDPEAGEFSHDLTAEMNRHIAETSSDREPWIWILEIVLSEMAAGRFIHPYQFAPVGPKEDPCLLLRTAHAIDHVQHTPALRDRWNAMPVKSHQVFKRQMMQAGVLVETDVERSINGKRNAHMVAISLARMADFGLYAAVPDFEQERGYQ